MCVPLPHEQDTNSADTAYEIVCLRILDICMDEARVRAVVDGLQAFAFTPKKAIKAVR